MVGHVTPPVTPAGAPPEVPAGTPPEAPPAGPPGAPREGPPGTPPEALAWDVDNCTISRAMAILGEKWTMVVLREVFTGIRRFDDMRVRTRIPRQVLANRLAALVEHGVLRREPYREPGARVRHEYRLTGMGFDLYPVLIALAGWGNRYLADPAGPPIQFAHRDCGAELHVEIHCAAGHHVPGHRDVLPRPGPGARRRDPAT